MYAANYVMDRVMWVRGKLGGTCKMWKKLPRFTQENAVGVAMRNRIFGEGAERMVSYFREYDVDGAFMGRGRWRRSPASSKT